jgi:hypothetical protein
MPKEEKVSLDNKTIAKLAIAIATAAHLTESGEVIGPLTNKVLVELDTIDSLEHFVSYHPKR